MRLLSMIDFAAAAPGSPLPALGSPALPPPALPAATPARRRRGLPIALGALAVLGLAGTATGFALKASSDSRNAELGRTKEGLLADLDDADATISDLEGRLGDAESQVTELEGDLADKSATVLTLQRSLATAQADLANAQADLEAAQASPDLSSAAGLPSLNDGVVSPAEAAMIAEQARSFGFDPAALEVEQYQEIAERACAAGSLVELNGVVGWMRTSHPQLTVDAAGFLAGGVGSAACQMHIYDLLGV